MRKTEIGEIAKRSAKLRTDANVRRVVEEGASRTTEDVALLVNTEDRMRYNLAYGEDMKSGVEGVPVVDHFLSPESDASCVRLREFEEWQERYSRIVGA